MPVSALPRKSADTDMSRTSTGSPQYVACSMRSASSSQPAKGSSCITSSPSRSGGISAACRCTSASRTSYGRAVTYFMHATASASTITFRIRASRCCCSAAASSPAAPCARRACSAAAAKAASTPARCWASACSLHTSCSTSSASRKGSASASRAPSVAASSSRSATYARLSPSSERHALKAGVAEEPRSAAQALSSSRCTAAKSGAKPSPCASRCSEDSCWCESTSRTTLASAVSSTKRQCAGSTGAGAWAGPVTPKLFPTRDSASSSTRSAIALHWWRLNSVALAASLTCESARRSASGVGPSASTS
mmetsp:Transcript_8789/g.30000  ORF Transcript_8789/g.30000 Transcript_8789/m.30000 type:complete len:309 (-) Transcript_8789:378-1304(-)